MKSLENKINPSPEIQRPEDVTIFLEQFRRQYSEGVHKSAVVENLIALLKTGQTFLDFNFPFVGSVVFVTPHNWNKELDSPGISGINRNNDLSLLITNNWIPESQFEKSLLPYKNIPDLTVHSNGDLRASCPGGSIGLFGAFDNVFLADTFQEINHKLGLKLTNSS